MPDTKKGGLDVTLDGDRLVEALKLANKVRPKRHALPILLNVLVEATEQFITLRSTNFAMEVLLELQGEVHQAGALVVPLVDFLDKVRKGEAANLKVSAGVTTLAVGGVQLQVEGPTTEDFPPAAGTAFEWEGNGILPKDSLLLAQTRIAPFAPTDQSRPVLRKVNFRPANNKLEIVVADGFRLGIASPTRPKGMTKPFMVEARELLHLPAADYEVRIAMKRGKPLDVSYGAIRFMRQGVSFTMADTDGTFPNYPQLVPTAKGRKVLARANAKEALEAVSRLPVKEGPGIIRITFPEKKVMDLAVRRYDTETPQGHVGIGVAGDISKEGKIAVAHHYLKDILKDMVGKFTLGIWSPSSPMVFEDQEAPVKWIVMPMFVQW